MKQPWRFQGDIAHGEEDPLVTVFVGDEKTDEDGNIFIVQDTRDPVRMRLSELDSHLDLVDGKKLDGVRIAKREELKAQAAEAQRADKARAHEAAKEDGASK